MPASWGLHTAYRELASCWCLLPFSLLRAPAACCLAPLSPCWCGSSGSAAAPSHPADRSRSAPQGALGAAWPHPACPSCIAQSTSTTDSSDLQDSAHAFELSAQARAPGPLTLASGEAQCDFCSHSRSRDGGRRRRCCWLTPVDTVLAPVLPGLATVLSCLVPVCTVQVCCTCVTVPVADQRERRVGAGWWIATRRETQPLGCGRTCLSCR